MKKRIPYIDVRLVRLNMLIVGLVLVPRAATEEDHRTSQAFICGCVRAVKLVQIILTKDLKGQLQFDR